MKPNSTQKDDENCNFLNIDNIFNSNTNDVMLDCNNIPSISDVIPGTKEIYDFIISIGSWAKTSCDCPSEECFCSSFSCCCGLLCNVKVKK
jgi:hypothetical protein